MSGWVDGEWQTRSRSWNPDWDLDLSLSIVWQFISESVTLNTNVLPFLCLSILNVVNTYNRQKFGSPAPVFVWFWVELRWKNDECLGEWSRMYLQSSLFFENLLRQKVSIIVMNKAAAVRELLLLYFGWWQFFLPGRAETNKLKCQKNIHHWVHTGKFCQKLDNLELWP